MLRNINPVSLPNTSLPTEGRFWPARLDPKQTAEFLGFQEHDIPVLVFHGLLEPLGKPVPNARKYFAAIQIYGLGQNPAWLNKATRVLYQHWQDKNANRTKDESAPVAEAALN
ncbi:MAG TPA: hypothetical protein PLC99_14955 [Verrucomicrobiota bacterium]|nr:hypothetical protein [Verrucomicrobiota bacterium]